MLPGPALDLGLPPEIAVRPLAGGVVDALPAPPARLALERVVIAPGVKAELRPAEGATALAVEDGTLTIVDDLGLEGSYPPGGNLLFGAGMQYGLGNGADDPVTLLRLSVGPGQPAAAQPDSTAELLLDTEVTTVPSTPALLILARTTWAPGAALPDHTHAGPVGFWVESGALTIGRPGGMEAQLERGKGIVIPADTPTR